MLDLLRPNAVDANTFDLAVIGAGSAGFSAAITAAEDGAGCTHWIWNHRWYLRQRRLRSFESDDPRCGNTTLG